MRFRRRRIIWSIITVVLLIILTPVTFLLLLIYGSGDHWSPEEAVRMKTVLNQVGDPDSALRYSGVASKRFADGEWVFGICHDSHGWMSKYRAGGMVALKDNRGDVRFFVGHVCGPDGLRPLMTESQTLDEFYERLNDHFHFSEFALGTRPVDSK